MDFGLENWIFDLNTTLSFSKDAVYFDYFPQSENRFMTNRFFQTDSLVFDEDDINSFDDFDRLRQDKKNWSFSLSHLLKTNKSMFEENEFDNDLRASFSAKITKNGY